MGITIRSALHIRWRPSLCYADRAIVIRMIKPEGFEQQVQLPGTLAIPDIEARQLLSDYITECDA